MPGVIPGVISTDNNGLSRGSPSKKNRLSLKFFQKKETKRALDFTESQENEQKGSEHRGSEIDQVVPAAQPSPVTCDKRENLLPFVGLNNLGNTCYLNSILQVLYFCPGFKPGVKHLFNIISKKKEALKDEANQKVDKGSCKEDSLASYELICSLQSLIISVEQLQASFLLNPEKYPDELATQPRRLLNTLRELNPMYEGYLQHDAQEVLQCILGNIQETCQILKKEELKGLPVALHAPPPAEGEAGAPRSPSDEGPGGLQRGKRKSDGGEAGNARKKAKVCKEQAAAAAEGSQRQTRSKRKATGERPAGPPHAPGPGPPAARAESAKPTQKKSRLKINWLKPAAKHPSILSKFCNLGKLAAEPGAEGRPKAGPPPAAANGDPEDDSAVCADDAEPPSPGGSEEEKETKPPAGPGLEQVGFELVEKLFQGQLVLRTRCLECECLTERREDFQDISVPVQEEEEQLGKAQESSEISPEPKTETKTLKWAISQFASVERIVGEDKYFCENCHHYTEAERSLLFDKMPEVITIHLKCFAASGLEFDCYGGGLSKINTPLLTPLRLSLGEWSTRPTNDSYGLFAVVMHSGITISSGHYTASVKVTDLSSLELDAGRLVPDRADEASQPEPLNEEEARAAVAGEYDDGEVSFRIGPAAKALTKKSMEAVGLLGGQKSRPDPELHGGKAAGADRAAGRDAEAEAGGERDGRPPKPDGAGPPGHQASYVVRSLKEYEGKWLLFDDSEVKVTEEKDFLNSLSPAAASTSTPYLLFYKKIVE
ncbi:LOW QUALITY PROTEIN: ubiquitin carboxyl-terminal hydrolase 1 [Tachyglossus aculeatus]|uniref:LOW QUALITY PROTEIN: ubiquitin carboxyl-terminal hydrolase 1 n=1 Tax=Tachyglossus aculeatus TaxID=9261 RepID=UPI0018F32906|nr:LOW QUALITY PROTEIN: ubiquitin carboxyl-terminal hydrolase 1 [Tachyglossus aculeatus]